MVGGVGCPRLCLYKLCMVICEIHGRTMSVVVRFSYVRVEAGVR